MDSNEHKKPRKYERVVRQSKYSFICLEVPLSLQRKELNSSNWSPSKIWAFIKPPDFSASITPLPRISSGNTRKTAPSSSASPKPSTFSNVLKWNHRTPTKLLRPSRTNLQTKINQKGLEMNRLMRSHQKRFRYNPLWCTPALEWCSIIGVDMITIFHRPKPKHKNNFDCSSFVLTSAATIFGVKGIFECICRILWFFLRGSHCLRAGAWKRGAV